MSGWLTNGATVITPDLLVGTEQIPIDTEFSQGQSPQSGALLTGVNGLGLGVVTTYVALAGGGQTGATLLGAEGVSQIATVASGNDSVALPLAVKGMRKFLINAAAANSAQVFGSGTDTINGVATGTGVAQAAGKAALYLCTKSAPAGAWFRILTA